MGLPKYIESSVLEAVGSQGSLSASLIWSRESLLTFRPYLRDTVPASTKLQTEMHIR